MAHPNIEELAEYWRYRRNGALAPARAHIDPGDFARLAPSAFIWGREMRGIYPFRLVGGRVGALFNRDLRGENGLTLWRPKDALALGGALEVILRRPEPLIAAAQMVTRAGERIEAELLFAPLCGPGGQPDRYLGLMQTASHSASPALRLELTDMKASESPPHLRLVAAYGQAV